MLSISSPPVILLLRIITGLIAGGVVALYTLIFFEITTYTFPSVQAWITLLPIISLGTSILWNILALATLYVPSRGGGIKIFHVTGDVMVAALVIGFGVTAFVHDDANYLSNGIWLQAEDDGKWLAYEVVAGILEIVALVLQLLLALLSYLAFRTLRQQRQLKLQQTQEHHIADKEQEGGLYIYEEAGDEHGHEHEQRHGQPPAYREEFGTKREWFGVREKVGGGRVDGDVAARMAVEEKRMAEKVRK